MWILVFSTNSLFCECLARGLARQPGIEGARHAATLGDALRVAAGDPISDILIDMEVTEPAKAVSRLRRVAPMALCFALSVDESSAESVVGSARCGVDGLVPRDAPLDAVPEILTNARAGEVALAPRAVGGLLRALGEAPVAAETPLPGKLTRREREVCVLVCEGLTNKEIAREMNRSVGTVKNHIHSILGKLDAPRRGAIPARFTGAGPMRDYLTQESRARSAKLFDQGPRSCQRNPA